MVDVFLAIITVLGLSFFEITSSLDNAVVNADVLATMSRKARRWFLTFGILISVFLVRAGLPFLIVYSLRPERGIAGTFTAVFTDDPTLARAIESSAPPLLAAGGLFLGFLFLHWLFLEPKNYGLVAERYAQKQGVWFYAIVSVILTLIIWYSIRVNPSIAFGAAVGSTLFFVTSGFRQSAEERERQMLGNERASGWSKLLYLEVIDASFSIDGVLGAFAFTLSVALIVIGTAIGAVTVRQLTVRNIESVRKYKYLKNGAMYSIVFLAALMIANAFGFRAPEWLTPLVTSFVLSFFFYRSWKANRARA